MHINTFIRSIFSKISRPLQHLRLVLRRLFQREPLDLYSYLKRFKGRRSSTFNNYIRYYRNWRILGTAATLSLLTLSALFLAPLYYKGSSTLATDVPQAETTLTLLSTSTTAQVSVDVISESGTFATSSNENSASFSVTSTNYTGYTLTLSPSSDSQDNTLASSAGSSFTSITDIDGVSSANFATSSYTSLNNKWGIAYNTSATYNTFYPASSTLTIGTTETANPSGSSDTYYIGLGVRADYAQAAGKYNNTNSNNSYLLTATGKAPTYQISYSDPSNEASNIPTPQTPSGSSSTTITLSSTIPSRTGYTFNGWCTVSTTAKTNGSYTCTGENAKTYSAGDTYALDPTSANVITLYTIWTRNNVTYALNYNANADTDTASNLPSTQTNTNNNGSYTFTIPTANIPSRDGYTFLGYDTNSSATTPTYAYNETTSAFTPSTLTLAQSSLFNTSESQTLYAIWEKNVTNVGNIQDLDASLCSADEPVLATDTRDGEKYYIQKLADGNCWMLDNLRLNPVNVTLANLKGKTNASDATLEYLKGSRTGTSSDRYATAAVTTWTSGYSYSAPLVNVTQIDNTTTGYGYGSKKRGVYYNYCAVSAGYYCWGNGTSSSDGSTDNPKDEDICPAGWRMPTGGPNGEYQVLYDKYSSTQTATSAASLQYNLSTPLSGRFYNGSFAYVDSGGLFWSSTRVSTDDMYYMYVSDSVVYPQSNSNRRNGLTVRCLMKNPQMQSNSAVLAALMPNDGNTAILTDARDGNDYTVAKINGLYWMTQNLRITGTIASTYSNFTRVSNFNVSQYDLTNTTYCNGGSSASSPIGYTNVCSHDSGNKDTGVWYNFAAASAGSITGYSNNSATTQDICPANWHLPTGPNTTSGTDFNKLVGNTTSGWQNPTTGLSAFGAVAGGYYNNGSLYGTGNGSWWSASASGAYNRYSLLYNSSNGQFYVNDGRSRYVGFFVRCVRTP